MISQRTCGGRGTRGPWRGVYYGYGASLGVGRILNVGISGDKSLRGIGLGAVLFLVLRLGLLLLVEFALVLLVLGDAALWRRRLA